jgi:hypothetical protein
MSMFEILFDQHAMPEILRVFGVSIVYVAGNQEIPVTATIPEADAKVDDAEGVQTSLRLWDWIIEASLLVANGQPMTPRPGHRIRRTIRGQVHQFEVVPIGDQPAAVWDDTENRRWLIHTKYVGTL